MAWSKALAVVAAAAGVWTGARAVSAARRRVSVRGKVVLVTGGSRGLGLCLVRELVKRGAKVALAARDTEELGHVADELNAMVVPCDLADPSQITDLVAAVTAELGPIEVLINNAGIIQVGPVETMTQPNFEHAMKLHFWAPLHLISAVLPSMRARRSGRIINIASIGGRVAVPHLLPYSASKFALVGLSRGLRIELAKYGINVTTVCPGLIRTGSARHATFKGKNREELQWFAAASALPGLSMTATHAAKRIVRAIEHGETEIVLGLAAKLGALAQDLSPALVANILALTDRALPSAGGIGTAEAKGAESGADELPVWIRTPLSQAEADNNELVDGSLFDRPLDPTRH